MKRTFFLKPFSFENFWTHFSFKELFKNLFAALGALWLILEISSYFGGNGFNSFVKPYWWIFLIIGLLYSVSSSLPKSKYTFFIPKRDTKLSITVNDIFKNEGKIVVPINNKFKVNAGGHILSSTSVLSQLVKKCYDRKPENLQYEIDNELRNNATNIFNA